MDKKIFDQPQWHAPEITPTRGAEGRGINYPSIWPDESYVLIGEKGYNVHINRDGKAEINLPDGPTTLETYLGQEGFTPLSERTPVLAIGSNRAPRQMFDKLSKLEDASPDDLTLPTFSLEIEGVDVVFAARPSFQGAFPATMFAGPETETTKIDVGISFLNDRQLAMIDKSEGSSYERRVLPGCEITVNSESREVQYYHTTGAVFWDERGPRALAAVKSEGRTFEEVNQADFMDVVLGHMKEQGGMRLLEGIYFDVDDEIDAQVLRSYDNTPPYAQELSGTFYRGQVGLEKNEKPKTKGTAAVFRKMGELGLTRVVSVPEDIQVKVRKGQDIR